MSSLTITIKPKDHRKMLIEMDADKFEQLAAKLGFFSDAFLKSCKEAEKDYARGRVMKIQSLRELRK